VNFFWVHLRFQRTTNSIKVKKRTTQDRHPSASHARNGQPHRHFAAADIADHAGQQQNQEGQIKGQMIPPFGWLKENKQKTDII